MSKHYKKDIKIAVGSEDFKKLKYDWSEKDNLVAWRYGDHLVRIESVAIEQTE